MVQGAVAGVFDFARADPRDRRWWIRLGILADRIEDDNVARIRAMNHAAASALLARADLSEQGMDRLGDDAEAQVTGVKRHLFPWITFDRGTITRQAIERMNAQWIREWGDPALATTAARIDATVAAMQRQLEASRPGRR